MSIQAMMRVPPEERDVQWLAYSLQEAVRLEWSTIPPYLCAYWSIKPGPTAPQSTRDTRDAIGSIVIQEMLHMGLACNILAGIGGTPNIYSENFAPRYPAELPGHVQPGLVVGLAGLSRDEPGNKEQVGTFLQIELPEDPLAAAERDFATIGEFYDALCLALEQVGPTFRPDRQLTNDLMDQLVVVGSVPEARAAIDLIKRQGEGTDCSPFVDGSRQQIAPQHELAHYYRFGQIYYEHVLQPDPTSPTGWSFSGPSIPFPDAHDLYLMAEVPPEDSFDRQYTAVLKLLHDAWAQGNGQKLSDAVTAMDYVLGMEALALLSAGNPTGSGQGIKGPDFRFVRA
jgi:hypothetical protein